MRYVPHLENRKGIRTKRHQLGGNCPFDPQQPTFDYHRQLESLPPQKPNRTHGAASRAKLLHRSRLNLYRYRPTERSPPTDTRSRAMRCRRRSLPVSAPPTTSKRRWEVEPLVAYHMHRDFHNLRSVRSLALKLAPSSLRALTLLMKADSYGRKVELPDAPEHIQRLEKIAAELNLQNQAPQPIIRGRHLIQRRLEPGEQFTLILDSAFEAQLDGRCSNIDEGSQWLDDYLTNRVLATAIIASMEL